MKQNYQKENIDSFHKKMLTKVQKQLSKKNKNFESLKSKMVNKVIKNSLKSFKIYKFIKFHLNITFVECNQQANKRGMRHSADMI